MKKQKILLVALAIAIISCSVFAVLKYEQNKKDREFLGRLKGEVVFTRRDKDGVSNVWKINANGTGEKMLFHNDLNDFKTDSRSPRWSDDGKKIYFVSFDKSKENFLYEIDSSGLDYRINLENLKSKGECNNASCFSRESDIIHRQGDLYIIDENGVEIKIYNHIGYYNQDYFPGASEASWSPDKEYIIFNGSRGIMIADKHGRTAKLTDGSDADWKY